MNTQKVLDLTPSELLRRQEAGELWRLLDVREPWEIEIASVAGALSIPMRELPTRLHELDSSEAIAVLCHSGVRSARVAGWMDSNGFAIVANIVGGIDAWSIEIDSTIPRY